MRCGPRLGSEPKRDYVGGFRQNRDMHLGPDDLEKHASFVLAHLIDTSDWVFRRVESVSFLDDQLILRRMSMDFQFPPEFVSEMRDSSFLLVPLAFLKKQPLIRLDVRDESGAALPILTKQQNGELTSTLIEILARDIIAPAQLPAAIQGLLNDITTGSPEGKASKAWIAFESLRTSSDLARDLLKNPFFHDLLEATRDNFLLIATLQERHGNRRILKYSYVEELDWEQPTRPGAVPDWIWLRKRLSWAGNQIPETFAWANSDFDFAIPEIGLGGSYHFEVEAPDGLETVEAALISEPGPQILMARNYPAAIVHLYTSAQEQGTSAHVWFAIRARLHGTLRAALAVSASTTFVLMGGALFPWIPREAGGTTTTLLLTLIGLISAFIARPGENSLATRLLFGPRAAVAASGMLAYLAAIASATGHLEWWTQLGGLAGICTGLLIMAVLNTKFVPVTR
jgi:hypothetical protein